MSEHRRLKIKFGDAEFEAEVPEGKVQPMYDRFLSILERRRASLFRRISATNVGSSNKSSTEEVGRNTFLCVHHEISAPDDPLLTRVFDLRQDGAVILKALPNGPARHADAMLLLLYGYHQLKNDRPISARELNWAAEQSGISLRRHSNGPSRNRPYLVRAGYGKGSNYRLNSEGLAVAKEIIAAVIERTERAALRTDMPRTRGDIFSGSVTQRDAI